MISGNGLGYGRISWVINREERREVLPISSNNGGTVHRRLGRFLPLCRFEDHRSMGEIRKPLIIVPCHLWSYH